MLHTVYTPHMYAAEKPQHRAEPALLSPYRVLKRGCVPPMHAGLSGWFRRVRRRFPALLTVAALATRAVTPRVHQHREEYLQHREECTHTARNVSHTARNVPTPRGISLLL